MKTILTVIFSTLILPLVAQYVAKTTIYSAKMKKNIETIIITPDIHVGVNYKTVYILHGYSGNPERTVQEDIPNLVDKAKVFQTIYVLPNGNFNSWYVDSPVDSSSQYSTFIGRELVEYIDRNYPTQPSRNARGILGWSMGGYGALHIGVAYPQTFSIIGSSCGAIDFNRFGNAYHAYQVDKVLGAFKDLDARDRIYDNEDKMKTNNQHYILDCGTEDQQMLEMNRTFHHQLTSKNIEHLYIESKGGHDKAYWSKSLNHQLALFQNYFQNERL
ncbi:alpha/beta hydrolase [Sphingobacterium sp.]|uniref:alpha/beta hydrolase n=1 Tax=Sphingobacterium sp. TaxID=341027 RepID=UPI002899D21F|nr:alpha/beta hydrolase-fold protein [Sphingobacterium sp.]